MKIRLTNAWDVIPTEAIRIQKKLQAKVCLENKFSRIRLVAGCDIAIDAEKKLGYGGVIVYSYPDFNEIERKGTVADLRFPYIPGLLSFREAPVLLSAMSLLETEPDLFIFDGHGIAHPRGLGIASHMGLILNKPTLGCAKSLLCGTYNEPKAMMGSISPLEYKGSLVGNVLRTRNKVSPVFVSAGHKIDLPTATKILFESCDGYRIPKPTREADRFVGQLKP